MADQKPKTLTQLPLIAPISVMPGPSPTEVGIEVLSEGGEPVVIMQFVTRHGVQFYFLSTDAARAIGDRLKDVAGSILVVPPSAMPPKP